jgi:hypothetical protein
MLMGIMLPLSSTMNFRTVGGVNTRGNWLKLTSAHYYMGMKINGLYFLFYVAV